MKCRTNNFEAYDPGGISARTAASSRQFTPRDALAGHLAAVIPGLPQEALESAAVGLTTLGYRQPDYAATLTLLGEHTFLEEDEGDGWDEQRVCWYRCSCKKVETPMYPDRARRVCEFQQGAYDGPHHAHVAEILTGINPEDAPKPEYYPVLTEDANVAGTNQLRSQLGDFTSPDNLMRKRAKFVLRAALPYLSVELIGGGR
jgi:hypothetical protein